MSGSTAIPGLPLSLRLPLLKLSLALLLELSLPPLLALLFELCDGQLHEIVNSDLILYRL